MVEEGQKKGISRRTVAKGAAWAIPAIPLVVATPAYAASPTCVTLAVTGCRSLTGCTKEYTVQLCNTCSYAVQITGIFSNSQELWTNNTGCPNLTGTAYTGSLAPSTTCVPVSLYSGSAATYIYATYTVNGVSYETAHYQTGPNSC